MIGHPVFRVLRAGFTSEPSEMRTDEFRCKIKYSTKFMER